jgi:folate-dependent tRNA-U54 methylase TrmFO/GidA
MTQRRLGHEWIGPVTKWAVYSAAAAISIYAGICLFHTEFTEIPALSMVPQIAGVGGFVAALAIGVLVAHDAQESVAGATMSDWEMIRQTVRRSKEASDYVNAILERGGKVRGWHVRRVAKLGLATTSDGA